MAGSSENGHGRSDDPDSEASSPPLAEAERAVLSIAEKLRKRAEKLRIKTIGPIKTHCQTCLEKHGRKWDTFSCLCSAPDVVLDAYQECLEGKRKPPRRFVSPIVYIGKGLNKEQIKEFY